MIRKVCISRKDLDDYDFFSTLREARVHLKFVESRNNLPFEIVRCYRSYWQDSVSFLGYYVVQSCFVPSKDFDTL